MSDDKTTIRIPEEDYAVAKEKKEAAGQTWGEYAADKNRPMPEVSEVADALADELGLDELSGNETEAEE